MRRIRLVLAVLMMMVLLATTAAPAMAWGRDGRDRDDFRHFNNCCVNRGFVTPVFSTFGCFTGLFGCGLFNGLTGFNTGFNTGGLVINNGNFTL
jgi:hypothetical protein